MCELWSNSTADQHFVELLKGSGGEKLIEQRLIRLAGEATLTRAEGLELGLERLKDWFHDPQLRTVRKITIGRHRIYVQGRHSECRFIVRYIKQFKKTGVDEEQTDRFKNRIFRALKEPSTRMLRGPD